MNILSLTPEELERLTPEQLLEELNHLTSQELKRFTPQQQGAVMETVDPRWRLTPEERRRRDAARALADPDTWRKIGSSCVEPILGSYQKGHITIAEATDIIDRISIGCWPQARVELIGETAALALRVPSHQDRKPGETKPVYPECIKSGTADLIICLKEKKPKKRVTPGISNRSTFDPSSPLIEETLQILTTLRWFGDVPTPAPSTIADWVKWRRLQRLTPGQTPRKGRPRSRQ